MSLESPVVWGASALLSLPFAFVACLSLWASAAWGIGRIVTSLLLLAVATWLFFAGRPRPRVVLIGADGRVTDKEGRSILDDTTRLTLASVAAIGLRSPCRRFELRAANDLGTTVSLLDAEDPSIVLDAARRLSTRMAIPVEVRIEYSGTLPFAVTTQPSRPAASPPATLLRQISRHCAFDVWLGLGGAAFVWIVAGSLTHAHWLRGGTVDAAGLTLLGALLAIGLLLPCTVMRARWQLQRVTAGAAEPARGAQRRDVPLRPPSFAQRVTRRRAPSWGQPPDNLALVSAGDGESWYLVYVVSGEIGALAVPCPAAWDPNWHHAKI